MRRWMQLLALSILLLSGLETEAQRLKIPRRHDKPPGPPLSPEEAVKKMTVPEGFTVEIVAAEPDIVNPVAMAIDEKGRFWITESLEYPRKSPGPGRDRVKVLEDTTGDGKTDSVKVFLDGLNIPSGVQVGHGGVWISNSPDILFVPDADQDGVPDGPAQVVVTGFGRTDTHELPNSLTWGPDGWLYGLNGVFNHSHVKYPKSNPNYTEDHKGWPLTCAMFRIHPRTWEFQVFAEGTSNPWGIAFNEDGEAFISACVIDHLWHITETGYYHRQGGPYPPFTWKIESIVDHKHQKAAYCGIHYFDSDAYPEKYRRKLYMGNIHGGCINSDRLEKNGSTYKGFPEPDFLTANDAWFMPVVQKTGPDGSLYILDWYDRYHCYQDANADPEGIERAKGRLYRVRYKDTPRRWGLDLGTAGFEQLVDQLGGDNDYVRSTALRLIQHRSLDKSEAQKLLGVARDKAASEIQRRNAILALAAQIENSEHNVLFFALAEYMKRDWPEQSDFIGAWIFRQMGDNPGLRAEARKKLEQHRLGVRVFDPKERMTSPRAILQSAIFWSKVSHDDWRVMENLILKLSEGRSDPLIPRIVWQNLHSRIEQHADKLVLLLGNQEYLSAVNDTRMMPRIVERILGRRNPDLSPVASLFKLVRSEAGANETLAAKCLDVLAERVQTRQIAGEQLEQLKSLMTEPVREILEDGKDSKLDRSALLLAASWRDEVGLKVARETIARREAGDEFRLAALKVLVSVRDEESLDTVEKILLSKGSSAKLRAGVIASLGDHTDPRVASVVLAAYSKLNEDYIRPKVIELLTQRSSWAKELLAAIGRKEIPATALNQNQVRRLLESNDGDLKQLVEKHWGTIRTTRDPKRVELIARMRKFFEENPGDAHAGVAVFKKVCGQCHKIYGEGAEVGPDITRNGRGNFEQLLSNVFDPSLVIGAAYQARTVVTDSGRVLTGLPVEENDQRVVLKVQGGKLETIPRNEIEVFKVSELSMMPEQLETQLKPKELADLFAFLRLDKPPTDPDARRIPAAAAPKK